MGKKTVLVLFGYLDEEHFFFLLRAKSNGRDFPGGTVVKNPPANVGDTGSSPDPGRSHMPQSNQAHAPQLLSPRPTTAEAREPRARAPQEKPPQ